MKNTQVPPMPRLEVANYDWAETLDGCFRFVPNTDYFVSVIDHGRTIAMSVRLNGQTLYLFFRPDFTMYSLDEELKVIEKGRVTTDLMIAFLDRYGDYLKKCKAQADAANIKTEEINKKIDDIYKIGYRIICLSITAVVFLITWLLV